MKQPVIILAHGILITAKVGELMFNKVRKGGLGLFLGDTKPKGLKLSEMMAKLLPNRAQHFTRDRIDFETQRSN